MPDRPIDDEDLERSVLPYLDRQFRTGRPILFLGAGFSLGVRNLHGAALPLLQDLRVPLSEICFPGSPVDDAESVGDLFEQARIRHRRKLEEFLKETFSVDAESIPSWYEPFFAFPWLRCYTLNIDDLPTAAERKFTLPRRIRPISATASPNRSFSNDPNILEVVQLNGSIADSPDQVTFSTPQYAQRLARREPWYAQLASELVSHPVIFVGTKLDEPPLWMHVEMRGSRGQPSLGELRTKSYIVAPSLPPSRRSLLATYHVFFIPGTAESFAGQVLARLQPAAKEGVSKLLSPERNPATLTELPDVLSLATDPARPTDFLLGSEPTWADIQSGRAIERDVDNVIDRICAGAMARDRARGLLILTGTAGSGKSTALMRLALKMAAQGRRVAWISESDNIPLSTLRRLVRNAQKLDILAIDGAESYGWGFAAAAREFASAVSRPLVVVSIRSGQVERSLDEALLGGIPIDEVAMPPLADGDIGRLLDTLAANN